MSRLIALDLDGTLLDPAGQITDETKAAIAQARQAGIKVVLSTGRSAQEAADFSTQAGCDNLSVCLGGAVLSDNSTGVHLRRWDIPENVSQTALELCLHRDIELMIFAGEQIVLDPFSHRSLSKTFPYPVFHNAAVVTEDPIAYLKEHDLPLTKIHGDWNQPAYPLAELSKLEGIELTSSNDHDFELVPKGVSKGRTLALLALLWGIPLDQCAAVGDSANDLAMLQAVGTPIAMGNACQAVKDAARYIAPDNAHEGVAQAIRWAMEQS